LEEGLKAHPEEIVPYKILPVAVHAVEKTVLRRLKLFNS
jgi:fructose-bisphosphate aldolase class II